MGATARLVAARRRDPQDLLDWNDRNRTFEQLAGFIPGVGGMVMAGATALPKPSPGSGSRVASSMSSASGQSLAGRFSRPMNRRRRDPSCSVKGSGESVRCRSDDRLTRNPAGWDAVYRRRCRPSKAQLVGATSIWALIPLRGPIQNRGPRVFRVVGRLKPDVPWKLPPPT